MIPRGVSFLNLKIDSFSENLTKIENILTQWSVAQAGSNYEKNLRSKISLYCPFKGNYKTIILCKSRKTLCSGQYTAESDNVVWAWHCRVKLQSVDDTAVSTAKSEWNACWLRRKSKQTQTLAIGGLSWGWLKKREIENLVTHSSHF